MDKGKIADLITDYIISSTSAVTCTGMSSVIGNISHDVFTDFLSKNEFNQKDLWKNVKSVIREIEYDDGAIVIDDTIIEKEYTSENDLICWHFDHSKGRNVKGINQINFLYQGKENNCIVSYELVKKTKTYTDKNGKTKRRSEKTKNEIVRDRMQIITYENHLKYRYILSDIWFSSKENMQFIVKKLKKSFVMPIKKNRTLAVSLKNKKDGNFIPVSELDIEDNTSKVVYLKGLDFPVRICKQVFTNKDNSVGVQYLVTNEVELNFEQITTIYQKRWSVEVFHKDLKSNLQIAKSPQKKVTTQSNYIFMCVLAHLKMLKIKIKKGLSHLGLKMKIYVSAMRKAMEEISSLKVKMKFSLP